MPIALRRSTFALVAVAALFAVVAAVPSDTSDLIPAALAELPAELGDDIAKLMADMGMEPEMTHFSRFVATDVSTVNHSLALIRCAFATATSARSHCSRARYARVVVHTVFPRAWSRDDASRTEPVSSDLTKINPSAGTPPRITTSSSTSSR